MKKTLLYKITLLVVLLSMLFSGCAKPAAQPPPASPTAPAPIPPTAPPAPAEATPTELSAAQLDALIGSASAPPPVVTGYRPAPGEEAQPDGAVELTFDQAMQAASVEGAFQLADPNGEPLPGRFSWPTANRLRFLPARPFEPGSAYQVTLDASATSAQGVSLSDAFSFRFNAITPLQVSQVFPVDGSKEVDPDTRITVMFNRPVVPLGIAEDQSKLPQPLVFSPETAGQGEWINTSVYVFQPEKPLKTGQTYSVAIPAGLKDAGGDSAAVLARQAAWKFETRPPGVFRITAGDYSIDAASLDVAASNLPPNLSIQIEFLQRMEPSSAANAVRLSGPDPAPIPFSAQWDAEGRILTLKPRRWLALNTHYRLEIGAQAQAADGGRLGKALTWNFYTVPAPAVTHTHPANGDKSSLEGGFIIQFASPMNPKTIADRVVFQPELETRNFWYNPYENSMHFYSLTPSTDYTVTLLPGMLDQYGNAINVRQTIRFSTGPLYPYAALNMPYTAIYRSGSPQDFYVQHTNVKSLHLELYRLTALEFINKQEFPKPIDQYRFKEEQLVRRFDVRTEAALNESANQALSLTGDGGKPLEPGFYFLALNTPDVKHAGAYLDGRLLAVVQANLSLKSSPGDALVWATDPETGRPLPGLDLKVYNRASLVGSGKTDKDGLLYVEIPFDPDKMWDTRYAVSEGGKAVAFAGSDWSSSVYPEDFGISREYTGQLYNASAYLYTERPLYRPGQPVYFKGVVRVDDDLAYRLPEQQQVEVTINSFEEKVYSERLSISDFGSFDGKFELDQEAALGSYYISARFPGSQRILGSVGFTVAEYRKPEFQIDMSATPESLLLGQSFQANLDARYYSGGGLSNAQVDWRLDSDPFTYRPPEKYSRYSFYDDERDAGSERMRSPEQVSKTISKGQAFTDDSGKLSLELLADAQGLPGSRQLTLWATITDLAGAAVSAQARVTAHRSRVYVGARPDQYVGQAGKEQKFHLAALDWDGNPVTGQKMSVQISERQWFSVQELDAQGVLQWKTSVKDLPVARFDTLVSGPDGLAEASFVPEHGGVYRAVVTAYDAQGNLSRAAAYQWVAGEDYIPWRQTNDRTFQLVADRDSYKPGDTAELLIASPYQGSARALVTVERGKVRQYEVIALESNSFIYRLPVSADMAPVVYASVLIVKGIDENNPRPSFKMGMAKLNVSTEKQALSVQVKADRPEAAPGEQVTYEVETRSADGKPVQAEVSLGLSDLATLSLMEMNSPPILDFFYSHRGLSVVTALSLAASMEEFNARLSEQVQEGRGAGSGGGKGEGAPGVPEVRQDFPDTAFWQAGLRTGPDGKASVRVKLPDNLTTWRMDARAVTVDTLVGQVTSDLVSTRPLLVRPQTPRFFVAGDQAVLGAAVHNNTGADLDVSVKLAAQGVTLDAPAEQVVSIPTGRQAYVAWKVRVPTDSQRVDLVFSARGGEYQDASRPTLGTLDNNGIPVYRYEALESVGTAGQLDGEGVRTEAVRLPDQFTVESGELTVKIEPSLAASMTAGLDYLEQFPYECTEQTISRFLPNLYAYRALQSAGVQDQALERKLKSLVNSALQRLYSQQNADGGWGWWGATRSDPLTSAYVALGLVEAREADYRVDESVLKRGLTYLEMEGLRGFSNTKAEATSSRNRQAFVLYVLAVAGQPDVNKTVRLYAERRWLDLYARGFLAQTLQRIDPADPRLDDLRSELVDAASLSATGAHWQEHSTDFWNWNSDTRSTAIVLDTLIRLDPQNPVNANAVRWLMHTRKEGHWKSTQETAWAVKALTGWLNVTGELKGSYAYAVTLNDAPLGKGQVSAENVREAQTLKVKVADLLQGEANRLVFARTAGQGRLYYTTHLSVNLPVSEVQALDQGVVLSRRYFHPDDLKTPVTAAQKGDLLMAQLTIVAANDLHYLIVEDPLPAGLETVDATLKSSPEPAQPELYDWSRVGEQGWGWWYFPHAELRDEKVVLSADYLPAGTYVYTYQVRAGTAGDFQVIPPTAREFYFPEVYGRGDGSLFRVEE